MKVKNVSRQPLCLQGQAGGIHLMPGEVREVGDGELGSSQAVNFLKQGLLQVLQETPKPQAKPTKEPVKTKESMNG